MQDDKDNNLLIIYTATLLSKIYVFYARTWRYREFEKNSLTFHRNVIQPIIKNYEQYGIFNHEEQMLEEISKHEVNIKLLARIIQVRELNMNMQLSQQFL